MKCVIFVRLRRQSRYPWQFAYCHRQKPPGPLILASHNLEAWAHASHAEATGISVGRMHSFKKVESTIWRRYIERLERNAVAEADLVLTVSPNDRQGFIDYYGVDPARVVEIPNGADTKRLAPVDGETKRALKQRLGLPMKPTAIYLASQAHPPHLAGLTWIRRVAARMDGFTFLVVGGISSRAQVKGNVIATGFVDDPCSYLQAADISLCPIQYGGGTKIKVLESLAVALPTVVFSETIQGTALRHQEHLLAVDKSEEALVSALNRLVENRELADRLGVAGRDFVVEHHDWERIAAKLKSVLLQLTPSGSRSSEF
jgi:glycosyltransferase involved in cell wall biosynthesis